MGAVFVMSHQVGFAQKKDASTKKIEITPAQQLEAEGHFTDGMKYFMMEDYDKAIAPLEKALSITPKNSGVLYALGKVYRKLEAEDKAIGYIQKAIELDPSNASYNELLADLYVKNKQFSEAQTVYQKLVNLFPNNPEYYLQPGALYIFDNRLDDAVKAFDRAEKVLGISEELSRQKQAVLLKIGKVDDAIKEGEKLIASDPEEIDYIIDQAELLIANKRNDQAIPYLEKILKMNPGNAQAHVTIWVNDPRLWNLGNTKCNCNGAIIVANLLPVTLVLCKKCQNCTVVVIIDHGVHLGRIIRAQLVLHKCKKKRMFDPTGNTS